MRRDNLGFVLFGNTKSACATGIPLSCHQSVVPKAWTNSPLKFQNELKFCWEAWEKYESLFSHPNVIVCKEYGEIGKGTYLHLYFINKKNINYFTRTTSN